MILITVTVNWVRAGIWHQDALVVLHHQDNTELVHGKRLTNGVNLFKLHKDFMHAFILKKNLLLQF